MQRRKEIKGTRSQLSLFVPIKWIEEGRRYKRIGGYFGVFQVSKQQGSTKDNG